MQGENKLVRKGARQSWRNNHLKEDTRSKKRACKVWEKKGLISKEDYVLSEKCRDKLKIAKSQVESGLAKDIETCSRRIFRHINKKRAQKEEIFLSHNFFLYFLFTFSIMDLAE